MTILYTARASADGGRSNHGYEAQDLVEAAHKVCPIPTRCAAISISVCM